MIQAINPPSFNALGCLDQILWKGSGPPSATTTSAYRVKGGWRYSDRIFACLIILYRPAYFA